MHLGALIICQLLLIGSQRASVGVLSDLKYSINIDNEGLLVRLQGFCFSPRRGIACCRPKRPCVFVHVLKYAREKVFTFSLTPTLKKTFGINLNGFVHVQ